MLQSISNTWLFGISFCIHIRGKKKNSFVTPKWIFIVFPMCLSHMNFFCFSKISGKGQLTNDRIHSCKNLKNWVRKMKRKRKQKHLYERITIEFVFCIYVYLLYNCIWGLLNVKRRQRYRPQPWQTDIYIDTMDKILSIVERWDSQPENVINNYFIFIVNNDEIVRWLYAQYLYMPCELWMRKRKYFNFIGLRVSIYIYEKKKIKMKRKSKMVSSIAWPFAPLELLLYKLPQIFYLQF